MFSRGTFISFILCPKDHFHSFYTHFKLCFSMECCFPRFLSKRIRNELKLGIEKGREGFKYCFFVTEIDCIKLYSRYTFVL